MWLNRKALTEADGDDLDRMNQKALGEFDKGDTGDGGAEKGAGNKGKIQFPYTNPLADREDIPMDLAQKFIPNNLPYVKNKHPLNRFVNWLLRKPNAQTGYVECDSPQAGYNQDRDRTTGNTGYDATGYQNTEKQPAGQEGATWKVYPD